MGSCFCVGIMIVSIGIWFEFLTIDVLIGGVNHY